jgi:hypothetical protein
MPHPLSILIIEDKAPHAKAALRPYWKQNNRQWF